MNFIDIQSQTDLRNIAIEKVGVCKVKYPIIVEDRTNESQHTIAELDIFVELLHNHRGTHMSRFIEVLNFYHKETLINKLPFFLEDIKKELDADAAYITLKFPYFISKVAPVSKMKSLMSYDCIFEASLKEHFQLTIGVDVPVTTLCPCSKEISTYGAHNQRSIVTAKIRYNEFIWLEEIIEKIESSASCEIYSLLKRPDEKFVTEKAYNNPKFVEDIVRDLYLIFRNDPRISAFTVQSDNFESIHNHNAYAFVSYNWN